MTPPAGSSLGTHSIGRPRWGQHGARTEPSPGPELQGGLGHHSIHRSSSAGPEGARSFFAQNPVPEHRLLHEEQARRPHEQIRDQARCLDRPGGQPSSMQARSLSLEVAPPQQREHSAVRDSQWNSRAKLDSRDRGSLGSREAVALSLAQGHKASARSSSKQKTPWRREDGFALPKQFQHPEHLFPRQAPPAARALSHWWLSFIHRGDFSLTCSCSTRGRATPIT